MDYTLNLHGTCCINNQWSLMMWCDLSKHHQTGWNLSKQQTGGSTSMYCSSLLWSCREFSRLW